MAQDTIATDETTVVELTDGTRLVARDDGGGAVLEAWDDPDTENEIDYARWDYDSFRDARLHAGLWILSNGFDRPDRSSIHFVPTAVVAAGTPAVAAWLYLHGAYGTTGSRALVADQLDVSEHTVSSYLTRVRSEVPDRD
jgi:hypothetical protein